jgi:hypothetical protein
VALRLSAVGSGVFDGKKVGVSEGERVGVAISVGAANTVSMGACTVHESVGVKAVVVDDSVKDGVEAGATLHAKELNNKKMERRVLYFIGRHFIPPE